MKMRLKLYNAGTGELLGDVICDAVEEPADRALSTISLPDVEEHLFLTNVPYEGGGGAYWATPPFAPNGKRRVAIVAGFGSLHTLQVPPFGIRAEWRPIDAAP